MTESESINWFFPSGEFLTRQGLNDSGLETFLDNPLESLVRETIQNSLDAKSPDIQDKPVRVEFEFFDRPITEMPGINSLKKDYIPKSKKSWKQGSKEYGYLQLISDKLNNLSEIKILRISDYNTTGLDEDRWDALVTETGVSSKSDDTAGGSKGIGKNAPFAASDFRTVIYNTKTEHYEKSIGVMIGVSYTEKNNIVSQPRGYFGSGKSMPFMHQYAFTKDRNEIGTDVFIIGVKPEFYDIQNIIILNVLENFLLSIYSGSLEVVVDNNCINNKSLSKCIDSLSFSENEKEYSRLLNTKKYYDVLTNKETQSVSLHSNFVDKYSFITSTSDATLLILTADNLNATTQQVLLTRETGMKIREKSYRVGSSFSGIFQATGNELNIFLRELEGVEHNDWTSERAPFDNQETARNFLKDIYKFISDTIHSITDNDADEEIDAYGIAELLPDEDDNESKNDIDNNESINTEISGVKIRPVKKIKQKYNLEMQHHDKRKGGRIGPVPPNPPYVTPSAAPTKKLIRVLDSQIRPVEVDYKNGLYEIRIITGHTLNNARIKLALSGENGDYIVKVGSVEGNENYSIEDNDIILSTIPADTLIKAKIKIDYSHRARLKAIVYEN